MATTRTTAPTPEIDDAIVEQDPARSGRHNARLAGYGTHVWAVIAYLQGVDGDVLETARAYDVPEDVVRAAIRYYDDHRALIDAHLLLMDESHNN